MNVHIYKIYLEKCLYYFILESEFNENILIVLEINELASQFEMLSKFQKRNTGSSSARKLSGHLRFPHFKLKVISSLGRPEWSHINFIKVRHHFQILFSKCKKNRD